MKIFLDTAHLESIEKWAATGLIDGVTTNPTHLSKEGTDPKKLILKICKLLPEGEISVEVTQDDPKKVYEQALAIANLSDNILVKIPCHVRYYEVILKLVQEGIPVNITLVFTLLQSLMMCKLGVHYISPFVGRWDDIDIDGITLIPEIRNMVDMYLFDTQILAASLRTVPQFHDAIRAGADAVTLPVEVLEKATTHILTDQGIAKFNADWQKLGIKNFPG